MSEQITGTLEEIAIVKKSEPSAKKPWILRKITVDGEKYSTFDPVKATKGSTVEFSWTENDKGYKDVVKNSFRVLKEATPEQSQATEAKVAERTTSTNNSIENQVALKAAVEFVGQFSMEGDEALAFAAKAYKQFAALLHPTSTGETAAKKAPAKPKPVAAEDVNQDEQPDY